MTTDPHEILHGEQITPTANLRWYCVEQRSMKLQQEFIVQAFNNGILVESRTEWRDLPVVL